MKQGIFAAVAATALLLGCQAQPLAFTAGEKAEVAAEIAAARDAYFDAATHFDAEAMVAFWAPGFLHLSNAYVAPLTGEELREAWRPLSHIDMNISSSHVGVLTRDSGYTVLTASYVVFDKVGAIVDRNDWAGTHIWTRTDEGWKVQAVHEGRSRQDRPGGE